MAAQERTKATIYAVAARAGVSISTVSLAINHPQRVSDATRRRVLEAARAEHYRAPARSSGRGRSSPRMIAVAAPFTAWPSYFERLTGILERCASAGVDVTVHDLPPSERSTAPILDALPVRDDVDGIIVMGVPVSHETEATLLRSGPATVVVDADSDLPPVMVDDERAGRQIGEHLAALGHRCVLFAHEGQVSDDYVSAGMLRARGIETAISAAGGTLEGWRITGAPELDAILTKTGATAIAANNDLTAATVLALVATTGRRVPESVSVSGCDGGQLAEALALTTIVQPFADSGRAAADLLLELLDGGSPSLHRIVLSTQLRTAASTGRPAVQAPSA